MTANITISQIYYNASLANFFMRTQAQNTFEELCEKAVNLEALFNAIEDNYTDLDEFEETLYNDTTEEIMDYIGEEYFKMDYKYIQL